MSGSLWVGLGRRRRGSLPPARIRWPGCRFTGVLMSSIDVRFADVPGGRLGYRDLGDPDARPVLFLHGSGPGVTGWRNYSETVGAFAEDFRCIVLEFPGFGISEARGGHPVVDARDSCVEILDFLGIDRASIVGNSLGGIVGAGLAARQPDRVERLICIGGVGTTLFSPGPAEGIRLLMDFLDEPDKPALHRWLRSMVYDQALVTDKLLEERWAQVTEPGVIESMKSLYNPAAIAQVSRGEVSFDLGDVSAPTLLFWGRDDRVSPVDMSIMPMRLMPDVEVHILPDCGHWVMVEKKDAFERQAREFLLRG